MGQFLGFFDGYDEDGHPRNIGPDELHTDTSHPQGTDAEDLEVDFVGSSTMKRLDPATDELTNEPSGFDKLIPVGATVVDGVIRI